MKEGNLEKMNLNVYMDQVFNKDESTKEWILNLFELMNK
jgi:hypothetical protein